MLRKKYFAIFSYDCRPCLLQCCPACGGTLVLFHEKFGELNGDFRARLGSTGSSGRASNTGPEPRPWNPPQKGALPANALHGGWYCSTCGVHIMPEQMVRKGISLINTLRPRQNGRRFTDDTFQRIFLNGNVKFSIKISLKFVPKGQINNIPALVQIMAWRRPGDKPLSEK